MNRAVFLDRDGTINVEKNYLYKIEDFELLPGAAEGMKLLQERGYLLIVITNQSGIARGYYKESDLKDLNAWMRKELEDLGVRIDAVYYCPHLPDAKIKKYRIECDCRKPALGLFLRAAKEYDIDLSRSWAVGDKLRDCEICESTPCRGLLIGENETQEILRQVQNGEHRNVRYVPDLLEAAKTIVEET